VNGPIKAHIRKLRASRIFDYFQSFKDDYNNELTKPKEERRIPKWSCPKPTLHQCVADLCELFQKGEFITRKFKNTIMKSFESTGTAPKSDGKYIQYSQSTNKGSFPIFPTGTVAKSEFSKDENFIDLTQLLDLIDDDNDDNENND